MTITVIYPDANNEARVVYGRICAKGTATDTHSHANATKMYARLYADTHDPNPPYKPPIGVDPYLFSVVPNGANWQFNDLYYASSSASSPYPKNTLVLWADFPGDCYERKIVPFYGKNATQTDCEVHLRMRPKKKTKKKAR